jgi:4-oxalocrotonate tautomerase
MPVVIVEMWEGRTVEQKRNLVKALTQAMVEHAGSNPAHLHVIIHETPRESWGRDGTLATELEAPQMANERNDRTA